MPPYRYVPGLLPHPFLHASGHRNLPKVAPEVAFERGLDLFDQRFYWEAHEVWECLWRETDRSGPAALLLQGLIFWAAAALKRHLGDERSAARLLLEARARLSAVPVASARGLDLSRLLVRLDEPWPSLWVD